MSNLMPPPDFFSTMFLFFSGLTAFYSQIFEVLELSCFSVFSPPPLASCHPVKTSPAPLLLSKDFPPLGPVLWEPRLVSFNRESRRKSPAASSLAPLYPTSDCFSHNYLTSAPCRIERVDSCHPQILIATLVASALSRPSLACEVCRFFPGDALFHSVRNMWHSHRASPPSP